MPKRSQHKAKLITLDIAIIAVFSALLSGGKIALSAIPNVEIVTLLIAVYATAWGAKYTIPAVFVFVIIETIIWGFNTWVISYIIYWNALAIVYVLFSPLLKRIKPIIAVIMATIIAVIMTALFGVLTTFIDTLLAFTTQGFIVATQDFWYRFAVLYARGVVFFVIHIVSNAVMLSIGYYPLVKLLSKLKCKMYINCQKDNAGTTKLTADCQATTKNADNDNNDTQQ